MSFGRLRERLWNNHNVSIRVIYGAETCTVYRRHVKKLHAFVMRHLRSIMKIKWQDKVTNISFQAGRTHLYEIPHQKESLLDMTHFGDANYPPAEADSLLAATRRTTSTSPIQRHNQEK